MGTIGFMVFSWVVDNTISLYFLIRCRHNILAYIYSVFICEDTTLLVLFFSKRNLRWYAILINEGNEVVHIETQFFKSSHVLRGASIVSMNEDCHYFEWPSYLEKSGKGDKFYNLNKEKQQLWRRIKAFFFVKTYRINLSYRSLYRKS